MQHDQRAMLVEQVGHARRAEHVQWVTGDRTVPGSPSHVLSRGEPIVHDDQWVGKTKQGRGQLLRRGTFGL